MPLPRSLTWLAALSALVGCADSTRPTLDDVACLGHRGHVTDRTLENTLGAFQEAYNIGADGTELDVFHTRDNVAMVFHDQTLARLAQPKPGQSCDTERGIANFSHGELQHSCELINGDDIPTLESVFQRFSSTEFRLHLEFKDSLHPDTLALAKTYYPNANGRLHATTFLKDIVFGSSAEHDPHFPLLLAHRTYIDGMEYGFDGVDVGAISASAIDRLHASGKYVGVFGANNATDIRRALDKRVHYITTDDLPLCVRLKREALDEQR